MLVQEITSYSSIALRSLDDLQKGSTNEVIEIEMATIDLSVEVAVQ